MAVGGTIQGDLVVGGNAILTGGVTQSGQTLTPSNLTKFQFSLEYGQVTGTAVVAETKSSHVVRGSAGAVIGVQAAVIGAIATGGDRTVTVDVKKSTGGAAFATVCTSTIQFTNADTLRTAKSATLDGTQTSLVAGDILEFVITVAGAAGAQAQGLAVTLTLQEAP